MHFQHLLRPSERVGARLKPEALAVKIDGRHIGETEKVEVTVLMSDIRSYSTIAEHADPSQLAGQLNVHRAAMNDAILGESGTVMQFVGDAVMAVFGAPFAQADHAGGLHPRSSDLGFASCQKNGSSASFIVISPDSSQRASAYSLTRAQYRRVTCGNGPPHRRGYRH